MQALRLYDELGLLAPARVDDDSGYRYYTESQLDRAQLIAALRQLQIPLAEIKSIVDLEPDAAAARITEHWNAIETQHTAGRDLARYLIERLQGKRPAMHEVTTRDIPARSVLSVKRSVQGIDGVWAFGKEFISILRNHDLPRLDGWAGAFYCIWWGEVNDDSDGPLEWCRPVPAYQAEQLAIQVPQAPPTIGVPSSTWRTRCAAQFGYSVRPRASGPARPRSAIVTDTGWPHRG